MQPHPNQQPHNHNTLLFVIGIIAGIAKLLFIVFVGLLLFYIIHENISDNHYQRGCFSTGIDERTGKDIILCVD